MKRLTSSVLAGGFVVLGIACSTTETRLVSGDPAPAATDTPDGGGPDTDASSPPKEVGGCVTVVSNDAARSPKPARGRKPESCTTKEIDAMFDPALSFTQVKAAITAGCATCALSEQGDPTWGASVRNRDDAFNNLSACLEAKGETAACAEPFDIATLCEVDSCAKCTLQGDIDACIAQVSSKDGVCPNLPKVKAAAGHCSADFQAHFDGCNARAGVEYMCGGKADPLACSAAPQLGGAVVGVVGTVVPAFIGGTILDGTYVATKIEGFGPGLGASVVGVTAKATLTISGAGYQTISFSGADGTTKTAAGTQLAVGARLTQSQSCPTAQTLPQSFTATSTSLVLGLGFTAASPDSGIVVTYTKK